MEAEPNSQEDSHLNSSNARHKSPLRVFFNDIRLVCKLDSLGLEIARIAFPAALALAADPIASLIDTAFIGRIGPVELAAVGVAIAIFNQVSRIAIFPLVSITTSFVAEEDVACRKSTIDESQDLEKASPMKNEMKGFISSGSEGTSSSVTEEETCCGKHIEDESQNFEKAFPKINEMKELIPSGDNEKAVSKTSSSVGKSLSQTKPVHKKKHIPTVSTALVIGGVLGLLETALLIFAGKPFLNIMGVKSDSPMLHPASQYLTLRALGAPAVLLSLAMQGVFRGFKDTKTPLYATVAGDLTNIILDPIFIFTLRLGVIGAAIAHVISQYLISLILLLRLMSRVEVLPPSFKHLQFSRFLKNGFLLLGRVIAVTFCVTLAASLAARQGSIHMAAFQICLQVWLTTSLLADGLAVAGQAILATAFAEEDLKKATVTAARVLQLSLVLGLVLAVVLGIGMQFGARIFTKDINVIKLMHIGIPFVAATQPLNSIAFVFDGVNFGASDFAFSAYSMIFVAVISTVCLWLLSSSYGFVGIWIGLTIYMSLRMFAGFWRMGTARGPWTYLRTQIM
ncbi:protein DETOXIFICATION 42-like [Aristolochia californica]|uniref:protein DETOXIFICATION 42-like n=1 Tax=Aristolochia californica TaxID=171875 RepID=UPI0035DDC44B